MTLRVARITTANLCTVCLQCLYNSLTHCRYLNKYSSIKNTRITIRKNQQACFVDAKMQYIIAKITNNHRKVYLLCS